MKSSPMQNNKPIINFFQRKPHKGFSFSLEFIFNDIRERLANQIISHVYISKYHNTGYVSKIINIVEAAFRQGKDINHVTGEIHFLDLLMVKKRVLLTILDCGMMNNKTGLKAKIIKWIYLEWPVARARYIVAISEETKRQIISFTHCDPNKIFIIPVAVSKMFQPVPKDFNVEKPTVLHIGTGYNKNLKRLIEALKGINCQLIIIGKLTEDYITLLEQNNIDFRNEYNIPNERLLEVYTECDILSYTSTFEGFGMPIVEANSVERVVVTSNISSMPEVAGKAAALVDPYNIESIRGAFVKIIENKAYRDSLIEEGRLNKMRFNSDTIAQNYYQMYIKMLS